MQTLFYFGPDRTPFRLEGTLPFTEEGDIPFHGIISRGLLNAFSQKGIEAGAWHTFAHCLDAPRDPVKQESFFELIDLVEDLEVLSFGQSASVAQTYVERYCNERQHGEVKAELWNLKEGHTSSVWRVCLEGATGKELFALNVARDREAAVELEQSSRQLQKIGAGGDDLPLAKVLDITTVKDTRIPFEVTLTRNEWIEGGYEIHQRRGPSGEQEYLLVERFLTDPQNPSRITSVVGRVFSPAETAIIQQNLNAFIQKATRCLGTAPGININDGDLVWRHSEAVVVALS